MTTLLSDTTINRSHTKAG